MARVTINSRKYGPQTFFVQSTGGYVYRETANRPGTTGDQICDGGEFGGSTISATTESLERVVRRWHKQRLALLAKENCDEYA